MTVTRATNSAGHSRVERNAPKSIAATTRPPTCSGMTTGPRLLVRKIRDVLSLGVSATSARDCDAEPRA